MSTVCPAERPGRYKRRRLAILCSRHVLRPDKDVQCRYRICGTEIDVDVISPDGLNVGAASPWLRRAAEHADSYDVGEDQQVKAVTPAYFLATKLVAFADRGEDIQSSKDAEDIVALAVEVPTLIAQVVAAGLKTEVAELWRRVSEKFQFDAEDIPDFVDCHLHREDEKHRQRVIDTIVALWKG